MPKTVVPHLPVEQHHGARGKRAASHLPSWHHSCQRAAHAGDVAAVAPFSSAVQSQLVRVAAGQHPPEMHATCACVLLPVSESVLFVYEYACICK